METIPEKKPIQGTYIILYLAMLLFTLPTESLVLLQFLAPSWIVCVGSRPACAAFKMVVASWKSCAAAALML